MAGYGLEKDLVITNFTQATVEQFVSVLLQATPSWYVVGPNQEQDDAAKRVSQFLQAFYHDSNVVLAQEIAYRHTGITGAGWLKVGYNSLIDDVDIRCIDPLMVYPDPTANRLKDAEYVGIKHIYGEALAQRLFEKLDIEEAETAGTVETRSGEQDEAGEADDPLCWPPSSMLFTLSRFRQSLISSQSAVRCALLAHMIAGHRFSDGSPTYRSSWAP